MYLTEGDYGLDKFKYSMSFEALHYVSKRADYWEISDSARQWPQRNSVYRPVLKVCIE